MSDAAERFISELRAVPWLCKLGLPSSHDAEVIRIRDWQQWHGPETAGATLYNECTQLWRDEAFARIRAVDAVELVFLEGAARRVVHDAAAERVDYVVGQDPWYGPNAAVQSAAWLAGVVAVNTVTGALTTENSLLKGAWSWYLRGHWPHALDWSHHTDLARAIAAGLLEQKLVVL